VKGNLIGTDITGTQGMGETWGIRTFTPNHTIGGPEPGAGNVISGSVEGIFVGHDNVIVQGNLIGTDATGTQLIGGQVHGVRAVEHSTNLLIGGPGPGEGNVIAGSVLDGIRLERAELINSNSIQGNFIGTDRTGTLQLGNAGHGIRTENGGLLVGGSAPGAGNIIAFNGGAGVVVLGKTEASILGNSIFGNGQLGIDLDENGVTDNDAGDGDSGGNNRQNFPVLDSAMAAAGQTTIAGTFNSNPDTMYRIEFFASEFTDPTGHGEGQTFVGFADVLTDSSGDAAFAPAFAGELGSELAVSATATDPGGNTSEFSMIRAVGSLGDTADLEVTQLVTPDPIAPGIPASFTATVTNLGVDTASGVTLIGTVPENSAFVSAVPTQGTCGQLAGAITCTIGTLPAAGSVDVVITLTTLVQFLLENTVEVFAHQSDPNNTNNSHTAAVNSYPPADLVISKSAVPPVVPDGGTVTYTILVTNNGPSTILNIEVIDELPIELTPVSIDQTAGVCDFAGNTASCSSIHLTSGGSMTITIVATANGDDGPIANTARLEAPVYDPLPDNNLSTEIIMIGPTADLELTQTALPDTVTSGSVLNYTLTVTNLGAEDAVDVVLTDTLPDDVVINSITPSQGGCSETGGVVTCNLGALANSAAATTGIEVVAGAVGSSVTNTASVLANSPPDHDLTNNSSGDSVFVAEECVPALYGSAFFGSDGPAVLFSIDATTGADTEIGFIGFERVGAMAFDPDSGILFAAGEREDFSDTPVLLTINPNTGSGIEVADFGIGNGVTDIAFRNSDGVLFAFNGLGDVYTVDTVTAQETYVGPSSVSLGRGNGLVFSPSDILYQADSQVHIVDQATGQATNPVPLIYSPPADNVPRPAAMAFDPSSGLYYAIIKDGFQFSPETYLATIDLQSGVVTIIGETHDFMDGLAIECSGFNNRIFGHGFEDSDFPN